MPFIPDSEQEKKLPWDDQVKCRDPEHYPPSMRVFTESGRWICPTCGHITYIKPRKVEL